MKSVWRIFLFVCSVYLLLSVSLYFTQEYFIFQSSQLEADYQFEFDSTFTEFNLEHKGSMLNALHFQVKNPKGVILYFHGNRDDLSRWGQEIQPLLKYNYDLIVMDYRGYGKSEGEPNEQLMYEDADLFYEHAKTLFPEENIVVYGRSLGSTFATYLASEHSPQQLILETPFYCLKSVVREAIPFLPTDYMLNYRFETNRLAPKVSCPNLVILAMQDDVVSYDNGLRLTSQLKNNKSVSVQGATHNDLMGFPIYWETMDQLFESLTH